MAATLADHAGLPGPTLSIGHARRWREIALRIDEIGADYAVSDLAMALEVPRASLQVQPKIYVRDPATVAALLREEESPPGHGVLLIGTEGPELEGAADGHALRFTSIGQALIDGLAGTGRGSARAEVALHWWLLENLRPWERWEGRSARLGPTDRTVPESRARAAHASVDAPTDTGTRRSTYEHEEERLRPGADGRAAP
ncbi:hypothetical protein H3H54_14320 [Brachybacterium sp. Z12]|uniref:hypothetical protein n=1 Tax=Brachybacterium sp. Z12 TaxID=2759167 RepID=UPI001860FD28|nr:hypothetical protein [Brachybacterium sp. Z12]QNN82241.1 hypothetical protein H3H54_14320 [Brachybacterium sp. Z12]